MNDTAAARAQHPESKESIQTSNPPGLELKGHLPALDGVRGLAILMVLATHYLVAGTAPTLYGRIITKLSDYGAMGVDLFFVLSGFLITGILLDTRKKHAYFRNFYMRRALRIFPLYYGVLFVGLVLVPIFWNSPDLDTAVHNQAWLWGYSVNIFVSIHGKFDVLPFFNHFWSLAVEEHFYLVWPLVVYFNDSSRLKKIAVLVSIGALLLRLGMIMCGVNETAIYTLTPARMDALAMGGLLAAVAREKGGVERLRKLSLRVLVIACVFIVASFFFTLVFPRAQPYFHEIRGTAFTAVFCALLIEALIGPRIVQRFFKSGAMRFFGKYSYGLYVFHFIYGYLLLRHRTVDIVSRWVGSQTAAIFLQAIAATAVAVLISLLSYHLYEKHFLKLKKFF